MSSTRSKPLPTDRALIEKLSEHVGRLTGKDKLYLFLYFTCGLKIANICSYTGDSRDRIYRRLKSLIAAYGRNSHVLSSYEFYAESALVRRLVIERFFGLRSVAKLAERNHMTAYRVRCILRGASSKYNLK